MFAQHRDGREVAGAAVGGTVGVDAAAVGVLRRRAGAVDGRVRLDVARQPLAVRADVADFDEVPVEQRRAATLTFQFCAYGGFAAASMREDRRGPDERVRARDRRVPAYGFWKFRPAPLNWLNCAHGIELIGTCEAVPAPFWNWS